MSITVAAPNGLLRLNDLESVDRVFNEVEQLLKHVQKVLHVCLHERTSSNSADTSPKLQSLESLRLNIQQSAGALRMVNIEVAGVILDSLGQVITAFIETPLRLNAETLQTVDKVCFSLIEFLQITLKGKAVYPIGLFQPYQALNQIIDRHVQPADLWDYQFAWQNAVLPDIITSEQAQQEALGRLDRFMLSLLRGHLSAAQDFKTIALGLAEKIENQNTKNFWVLAAGFFDALCCGHAKLNINTKRAATQILTTYKAYIDHSFVIDEHLGKNLLFFCVPTKGIPTEPANHTVLDAVRKAYQIEHIVLVDYEKPLYGRIDPHFLKKAQKHVAEAKAAWSAFCSGEAIPMHSVINAFKDVCQSLAHLIPQSKNFAQILYKTAGQFVTQSQPPGPEISMEIATAVLYTEAIFSEIDLDSDELQERFARLTERIELAARDQKVLPLDPWIRALYHSINERETISNVVTELRVILSEIENNIDDFLRKSKNIKVLSRAVDDLRQMHGVLNVLGMDNAAQAIIAMQGQVNWVIRQASLGIPISEEDQNQEQVALLIDNLSSIGFLIDMLSYQPILARRLFVFDTQKQKLELLSNFEEKQNPALPETQDLASAQPQEIPTQEEPLLPTALPQIQPQTEQNQAELTEDPTTEQNTISLEEEEDKTTEYAAPADSTAEETKDVTAEDLASLFADTETLTVDDIENTAGSAVSTVESIEIEEDVGDDLREIFLEEAHEVIYDSRNLIQKLYQNIADQEALISLRRCFHTLKGSSRMVGLVDFGSAAYVCEQCFNGWLAVEDEKPIPRVLMDFATWAINQFEIWTKELQTPGQSSFTLAPELFEQEAHLVSVDYLKVKDTTPIKDKAQTSQSDDISVENEDTAPDTEEFSATLPLDIPSRSGNSEWLPTQPFDTDPHHEDTAQKAYEQTKEFLSSLSLSLEDTRLPEEELASPTVPSNVDELTDDDFDFVIPEEEIETELSSESLSDNTQQISETETQPNLEDLNAAKIAVNHIQSALSHWQSVGDGQALLQAQEQTSILVQLLRKLGYVGLASFGHDFESSINRFYQKIIGKDIPQNRSSTLILEKIADELKRLLEQFSKGQTDMPRMDLLIRLYQFNQQNVIDTFAENASSDDVGISVDLSDQTNNTSFTDKQSVEENTHEEVFLDHSLEEETLDVDDESSDQFTLANHKQSGNFGEEETFDLDISDAERQTQQTVDPVRQKNIQAILDVYQKIHRSDREAVTSDIFEIFDEEAKDLLPLLSSGLRECSINSSDHDQLRSVLRVLHTFKGSSRMSGAMHLGNMAHDLETELKRISELNHISENQMADVLGRLDDIETEFDDLKTVYVAYAAGEVTLNELINANKQIDSSFEETPAAATTDTQTAVITATDHQAQTEDLSQAKEPLPEEQISVEAKKTAVPDTTQLTTSVNQVITSELFPVFKEETNELLDIVHQGIDYWLQLELPSTDTLEDAMRALHTLKGNTRLVSAETLAQLVYQLEATLKTFKSSHAPTHVQVIDIEHKLSQIEAEFNRLCLAYEDYIQSHGDAGPSGKIDAIQDAAAHQKQNPPATDDEVSANDHPLEEEKSTQADQLTLIKLTSFHLVEEIATQLSQWCDTPAANLDTASIHNSLNSLREHSKNYNITEFNDLLDVFQHSVDEQTHQPCKSEKLENIIADLREIELCLHKFYANNSALHGQLQEQEELYSDILMHQLLTSAFSNDVMLDPVAADVTEEEQQEKPQEELQEEHIVETPDQDDLQVELQDNDFIAPPIEDETIPSADNETPQQPIKPQEELIEHSSEKVEPVSSPVIPAYAQNSLASHAIRTDVKPRLINPSAIRKTAVTGIGQMLRVRASLIDELVNRSGELNLQRTQLVGEVKQVKDTLLPELIANLERLRTQLRDIEIQAETQMSSRIDAARAEGHEFDPLEFDRYTRIQELTRMMAESVGDIDTVQKSLRQSVSNVEDGLIAQSRSSKELQHALLRARMVEFSSIAERFYRVVRMTARECGKQTQLTITGGEIEIDRVVLEHMAPAFEHILRNCVVHGIETTEKRQALGKPDFGQIKINLQQEGNDVSIKITDDGHGLDLEKIKAKAISMNLLAPDTKISDHDLAQMIYKSGLTTATQVTELAGRGIGLDMAHSEIVGLGGREEVFTKANQGTEFVVVLPLTTAVTQVLLVKAEEKIFGIPVGLVESIRRFTPEQVKDAVKRGKIDYLDEEIPAYSLGGLLDLNKDRTLLGERRFQWLILHSGEQRIAIAVDQVINSQEVIIRNVGTQFSYLSGFAGLTVLSGGHIVLIYNPVVLGRVFAQKGALSNLIELPPEESEVDLFLTQNVPGIESFDVDVTSEDQPLYSNKVLVVDDSLTVRRVTQRLLEKAGFDVVLAKDGQDAIDQIHTEIPALVLTDIEMPRMDGFELVRQLRGSSKTQMLPIIMITSRIAQKHHDYANELGVNYYLGKPFVEEQLLELVRRYVRHTEGPKK